MSVPTLKVEILPHTDVHAQQTRCKALRSVDIATQGTGFRYKKN